MRMYRCNNPVHGLKGREFEADPEACICECGWEWKNEIVRQGYMQELIILHFDPPSEFPNRGLRHLACDPKTAVGSSGSRATGEPSVVNCPRCKETDAFKNSARGANPMLDIPKAVEMVIAAAATEPKE